jgi:hypothetical protein
LKTYDAGGLERVEKVKPDPWNLTVNTGVGKHISNDLIDSCFSIPTKDNIKEDLI